MGTNSTPLRSASGQEVWRNAGRSARGAGQRSRLFGLALRPGFRLKARSPSIEPSGRGRRHELRQTEFEWQGQHLVWGGLSELHSPAAPPASEGRAASRTPRTLQRDPAQSSLRPSPAARLVARWAIDRINRHGQQASRENQPQAAHSGVSPALAVRPGSVRSRPASPR